MKAIKINSGDIILDFFSGSGTTAEAVMNVSAELEKHLKYIMVQWPEDLEDNLKKQQVVQSKLLKMQFLYVTN